MWSPVYLVGISIWPRAPCYFLPLAYILTGNWLRKTCVYKSGFIPGFEVDFLYPCVSGRYFRVMIPWSIGLWSHIWGWPGMLGPYPHWSSPHYDGRSATVPLREADHSGSRIYDTTLCCHHGLELFPLGRFMLLSTPEPWRYSWSQTWLWIVDPYIVA